MKTAFLFPGQGAQSVGMGKEMYIGNKIYKETFDSIDSCLDIDLKAACFDGLSMDKSEYVQPAIFAHSISLFKALNQSAQVYAGLSLGEYTALAAGDMIDIYDCARLVNKRGYIMDRAVPSGIGSMLSIIGLEIHEVKDIITGDDVYIANHLSQKQIVLGGRKDQLLAIEQKYKDVGGRTTMLNVSGPFHTPMLKSASNEFLGLLNKVNIINPKAIIYSNYSSLPYSSKQEVPDYLAKQMCSRVRWHDIIEGMLSSGIKRYVEIGPSMVLSKMLKRRTKGMDIEISSVRDLKTFNKYKGE